MNVHVRSMKRKVFPLLLTSDSIHSFISCVTYSGRIPLCTKRSSVWRVVNFLGALSGSCWAANDRNSPPVHFRTFSTCQYLQKHGRWRRLLPPLLRFWYQKYLHWEVIHDWVPFCYRMGWALVVSKVVGCFKQESYTLTKSCLNRIQLLILLIQ